MRNGQIVLVVLVMLCNLQTQCQSRLNRTSPSTSKPRGPHFLCHPQQSRALLQFKSHFLTDLQWKKSTWNGSTDCCSSWMGVTCNGVTGHVIGLDLSHNLLSPRDDDSKAETNTSGIFSSLFASLPDLYKLNLAHNDFGSHLSPGFASLPPSLTHLNLGHIELSGYFPSEISHLSKLVSLDLSGNHDLRFESATVLKSMARNLTRLRVLNLEGTSLLALPDSASSLMNLSSSLTSLSLSDSGLQGTFPESFLLLPNLLELDLSVNVNLSGSLPKRSNSTSLRVLQLYETGLSGDLPADSIGNLKSLQELDLHSCNFSGSLPVLSPRTIYFSASNNSFTGEIPSLICNASSLGVLDLSFNGLSGMIPRCLVNDTTSLEVLDLCMNNFHGTIPDTFAKGSELTLFNLKGNQLGGGLPRSLANCEKLEAFDVDDNSIVDVFPRWLQSLEQLRVLVLRSNKLYGRVDIDPKMNSSFPMLRILDLSSNNFSGALPTKLIKSLKGMINVSEDRGQPQYIENSGTGRVYAYSVTVTMKGVDMKLVKILKVLTTIDMSNNKFDGNIPLDFGSLHALKGLNLSHNYLAGPIPPSFGKLVNLEWLDLSSNQLVDRIPTQLLDLNSLAVLNLSHNRLQGPIPVGKQFNTFKDEAYVGNSGLCGFPLPTCGSKKSSPPTQTDFSDESNMAFSWKSSYVGYGCGTVFGMAMGYLVFSTGSPQWFVKMVEGGRRTKGRRLHRNAKARGRGTRS